jgi:NADH dehydrogenase/NADH:ubiquinone oxidoreductase subunit G
MTDTTTNTEGQPLAKQALYQEITTACDQLEIARYLKNEVKNSLQYFHAYKLENIKKNLTAFTNYLLFLNEENCRQIQALHIITESKKEVNNTLSYFYHHAELTKAESKEIVEKIESNTYQTISLIQGIKGLLLLTIDEFCNASPTRMAINAFIREKEKKKKKKNF